MTTTERDRILALAGMFQAAVLAQQLARRGYADEIPLEASARSILISDAINTASVFGGEMGVKLGLSTIRDKLAAAATDADFEIARYVLSLAQLGGALGRNRGMAEDIAEKINQIGLRVSKKNGEGFNSDIYTELADIYKHTISHLKPKIIVQGEQGHLSSQAVVDRVRTALFSGVRAAFLWNQLGGRRWHLVFGRKATLAGASAILAEIQST